MHQIEIWLVLYNKASMCTEYLNANLTHIPPIAEVALRRDAMPSDVSIVFYEPESKRGC